MLYRASSCRSFCHISKVGDLAHFCKIGRIVQNFIEREGALDLTPLSQVSTQDEDTKRRTWSHLSSKELSIHVLMNLKKKKHTPDLWFSHIKM